MLSFTEDTFEQAVIELFENMGYTHIYAPDMNRTDYNRPLLDDVLRDCLVRLNRSLPAVAIDEAILKLNDFDAGSLLQKNIIFMDYLQNGITVKYAVKGEERSSVVKLIDYADADKNDFYVVNQYTFMTGGNNDPEDWKEIIGTKSHKEELARKFKDNDDPMKIAIVVDMWLTGFDVPSLATMYVYKPMHGYNLMQAIARVNRVFKDKEGGLIVDYVGIASALKAAMKEYTKRDQSRYGDMDIAKVAYPKFQEKLQVCKDLLHSFDFSGFIGGSPLMMAKLVTGGVNFVLDAKAPKRKDLFLREALLLKQSHSLCSSMTTERERHEAAYMEAVRSTVVKITYGGSGGKTLDPRDAADNGLTMCWTMQ